MDPYGLAGAVTDSGERLTGGSRWSTIKEKVMKRTLCAIVALAAFSFFTGCSEEEPPSVRVANLRPTKANVQFKQANLYTINQNGVVTGTYSAFQDVAEGSLVVTAVIQDESISPSTSFTASANNNYTISILAGDPPALKVDVEEK